LSKKTNILLILASITFLILSSTNTVSSITVSSHIETTSKDIIDNGIKVPAGRYKEIELKAEYAGIASKTNTPTSVPYVLRMAKLTGPDRFIPNMNGIGVGQDADFGDDFFNGFAEWNLAELPKNIYVVNIGLRLKVTNYKDPVDWSFFDDNYIQLEINDMENRPSNRYIPTRETIVCDDTLFKDSSELEKNQNKEYYSTKTITLKRGDGFKPSANEYYWLNDKAVIDFRKHIKEGWFALGFCDNDRLYWKPKWSPFNLFFDYYLDKGVVLDYDEFYLKIIYVDKNAYHPPSACIDEISPEIVFKGNSVECKGHGIDFDGGEITGYRWKFDNQYIGSSSKVTIKNLPVGKHYLSLEVNKGYKSSGRWSYPVVLPFVVNGCEVNIDHPGKGGIYLNDREIFPPGTYKASNTVVIGRVTIRGNVITSDSTIKKLSFYIDDNDRTQECIITKDNDNKKWLFEWFGTLSKGTHDVNILGYVENGWHDKGTLRITVF